jgi:hypothetical protein
MQKFPWTCNLLILQPLGVWLPLCPRTLGPFSKGSAGGTLDAGDQMPKSSINNNQRSGSRTKAVLPVRLKGKDAAGIPFEELAHTLDVTPGGLRLGAVRRELCLQDEVTVFYRQRKGQYRVMWTKKLKGTSEFQVGLQSIVQDGDALWLGSPEAKLQASAVPAVSPAPVAPGAA